MATLFCNSRRKLSQGLLFWREAGKGIPVIFLHGAWNDSSQWVSVVESLSDNFHCLSPDLLGFGESENPYVHHSIDLQVECIAEFIQALKLEKVYLVGYSLGGWIAASYALKYPDQVGGLVLLAPEGVGIEGQEKYARKMRKLVSRPPILSTLLKFFRPLNKIGVVKAKIEKDFSQRQVLLEYPNACQLLFQRRESEIEAEFLDKRLHLMQVPVLILQGGQDLLDAVVKSQTYTQLLPKVALQIIAHAGNDLPGCCPGILARDIQNFITANASF
ncbi:alpha/beta hydrolase [Nodularia spumigena CS-591/04]|uniref:alpha/beta fold hydrolase n=1 Tax=Nodularia spumigena TaxID=70799 RepID=UPI0023308498|nr:alpha/beta hydrolase [Nodularia spumigena]MDB9323341.1 alpha/beta hydrolase [Nodularia spumigena CS-591/07A]MDB9330745.1 alpha/beta hydrolase [Nodularia spumigena CS-591/04]